MKKRQLKRKKNLLLHWTERTFLFSVLRPWAKGELSYNAKVTYLTSLQIKGRTREILFLQYLLVILSAVSIGS